MYRESRLRTALKSLSYRFFGTVTTIVTVILLSGKLEVAFAVGGIELISKLILYYSHERAWDLVPFGRFTLKPLVICLSGTADPRRKQLAESLSSTLNRLGLRTETLQLENGSPMNSQGPAPQSLLQIGMVSSLLERNGVAVIVEAEPLPVEAIQYLEDSCERFMHFPVACSEPALPPKKAAEISKGSRSPSKSERILDLAERNVEELAREILTTIKNGLMSPVR